VREDDGHESTQPLAQAAAAAGWTVEATWPSGQVDRIEGFSSEAKAIKWIAEQSKAGRVQPL